MCVYSNSEHDDYLWTVTHVFGCERMAEGGRGFQIDSCACSCIIVIHVGVLEKELVPKTSTTMLHVRIHVQCTIMHVFTQCIILFPAQFLFYW